MTNQKAKALELHREGKSYSEIATSLGISKTTAYTWVKEVERDAVQNDSNSNPTVNRPFGTFQTSRTAQFANNGALTESRSEISNNGRVKVKEPAYVAEQRQRIAELEATTKSLSEQLYETKLKQIAQLKRKVQHVQELLTESDGEVWSLDELYQNASDLEILRDDIIDIDANMQVWVDSHITPMIELLEMAAESLEDENLEEGEVYFYEA
jgi:transcriptional regulator with PAS, ATPase and Fis domain